MSSGFPLPARHDGWCQAVGGAVMVLRLEHNHVPKVEDAELGQVVQGHGRQVRQLVEAQDQDLQAAEGLVEVQSESAWGV